MTTKAAGKTAQPTHQAVEPSPEVLQAAYQIHTLTQLMYGELAATRPWLMPTMPTAQMAPPAVQANPWMPAMTTPWRTPWGW